MIKSIAHASFLVSDIKASLAFYCNVLGIQQNHNRPDFWFEGAWLDLGDGQQLHLMVLPNPDPRENRPEHGGRDRHVALVVSDLEALASRFDEAGVAYSRSKSGRAAFFCRDPDGNALEFAEDFTPPVR
ncbi:putative dioxygenase of extradiol dioxygenase family [Methylophaga frappieri]|uniref:Putative dioxygenase of extradiol dioxygenase family n=1 Tax=Methylophaga frappieri (strain ATCC BAA-2434 / DSM 25690 / JAM7) TaxID=754477 RepID=I1YG13_METFJ|nr:VOC family protein [Methylophaga frappieri]AFJ01856.1 putative dioxygenase of extradiol dioxygenase family [Methylophaga frappieri]